MSGLLVNEVKGENEVEKIRIEGESLVLHTKEGEGYNKIFNKLASMNAIEEDPFEIVKKSSTEISLPLNKRTAGLLRGSDYVSSKGYLKLLSTAAAIKIDKEEEEDENSSLRENELVTGLTSASIICISSDLI